MTLTDFRKRHRLLVKLGFRPMNYWKRGLAGHYNRSGYKWRVNCHGNIDRSCPHSEFDRWANSTEQTWDWENFKQEHK